MILLLQNNPIDCRAGFLPIIQFIAIHKDASNPNISNKGAFSQNIMDHKATNKNWNMLTRKLYNFFGNIAEHYIYAMQKLNLL